MHTLHTIEGTRGATRVQCVLLVTLPSLTFDFNRQAAIIKKNS